MVAPCKVLLSSEVVGGIERRRKVFSLVMAGVSSGAMMFSQERTGPWKLRYGIRCSHPQEDSRQCAGSPLLLWLEAHLWKAEVHQEPLKESG